METSLKLLLTAAALAFGAGTAHAQAGGATPAPSGAAPSLESSLGRDSPERDSYERESMAARDEALAKTRRERETSAKSNRAMPAKPEDVVAGKEVRDLKGAVIGTVESVSMSAAVVAGTGGKVEVALEAFGKNKKGLLFSMTKEEFDKIVADASKPAN